MRSLLLSSLLLLAACSSGPKNAEGETSVAEIDSLRSEISDDSEGNSRFFYIDEALQRQTMRLFGHEDSLGHVLAKLYAPDQFKNEPESDEYEPAYTLQTIELLEGTYTNTQGGCQSKTALLVRRTASYGEEEYYDLHFIENSEGELASSRIEFDGSYAQTSASLAFTSDYSLGDGCTTLAIVQSAEGGDIDLHRDRSLTFFLADENYFHSVLELVLEDTDVSEYEVTGDENKNATSELRDFELLPEKTNGLHDIRVTYQLKTNGEVTAESEAIHRFDGKKYSDQ